MPKTVDDYIIENQLFKDSFQSKNSDIKVEYLSCSHKILKKKFTIKKIQKPSIDEQTNLDQQKQKKLSYSLSCIQNQIKISRQLKSQRVLKCHKMLKSRNNVFAVYDLHPQKQLQKVLSNEYLTEQKKQTILNEIIQLVREFHQSNIVVGNICPQNLFLSYENKIVISNFLIARKVNDNETFQTDRFFLDKKCGYYAPQLIRNGLLGKSADIYSIGRIIKFMNFQKSENELLIPLLKSSYENIKEYIDRMVDENPLNRPDIRELEKSLRLSRSRNKSTCGSNCSREIEQKLNDTKIGLQSSKSQNNFRNISEKIKSTTLLRLDQKKQKQLQPSRYTANNRFLLSSRVLQLQSKTSIEVNLKLAKSHYDLFKFNEHQQKHQKLQPMTPKVGRNFTQSRVKEDDKAPNAKQKLKEIILQRNTVFFIIQMVHFISKQNSFTQLIFYLLEEALFYTQIMLISIKKLVNQQPSHRQQLQSILQQSQIQKAKIIQISSFFNHGTQFKKHDHFFFLEQLKKFGKHILSSYSPDYSSLVRASRESGSPKNIKMNIDNQKAKQNEEKLLKTFLILKRLEFRNYYQFFKTKVQNAEKKFWHENYHEFGKSFNEKHLAIQIKELISKR